MDLWDILPHTWIPCLLFAVVFQIRAMYLKRQLVKKYGFNFPPNFFKPVNLGELKTNYDMTELPDLKKIISRFIYSKRWFYRFLVLTVIIFLGPMIFKAWLSSPNPGSHK